MTGQPLDTHGRAAQPGVALGMPAMRPTDAEPRPGGLTDRYGRVATDLRVSLIDKCNLRCTYCMPTEGMVWMPKPMLMTASEIERLIRIAVSSLGAAELRLTGGEPLVRKDLEDIVAAVREAHPNLPISMTTNAVGLAERAQGLKDAGLNRVNVSLDTLRTETFETLTRRSQLQRVLDGIAAADRVGLTPIKVNAVMLRGTNDDEIVPLATWALGNGYEMRYIEHMPLDGDRAWTKDHVVTAEEIRTTLASAFAVSPTRQVRAGAPADRYDLRAIGQSESEPALGRIGIISSVTEPFCAACTRTRLTADGRVRSCLFSHQEVDLLGLVRSGVDDGGIARAWQDAMWAKPRAHGNDAAGFERDEFVQPDRSMSAIGG